MLNSSKLINLITKDYLSLIYGYALRRTNSREDAEDLAQDILTELVSSINNLRDQKAYNAFIWAVAGNTYKRWLKKHKNSSFEYIENYQAAGIYNVEDMGDIDDGLVNLEEINQLRMEISLLSKTYREIVVMYYIDEMSCSEIAQKLNLTADTVKYFLYKARNIIKDGISMNREFGEKSYKPAEFSIMYRGEYSVDYYDLSKRKLPGNILLTAMDKPISISEIGMETGVPVTYLEDEISLLEEKGLISNIKGDKYQTDIIVFTRKLNEIIDSILKKYAKGAAEGLYNGFIKIEEDFRKATFTDPEINRDRLLWTILPIILCMDIADILHSENIKALPLLKQGNHGLVWGSESTVKPWDWGITSKSVTKYAGKGGKSTIVKLLLGFYPIETGNIFINNRSISEYNLKDLRNMIAYVPQDAYLFEGTIEENIRYGKLTASHDEIIAAAKLANAHEFILEQPEEYNTKIGEKGAKLSGGQKQRIAIARALLKDAPILLLDEATSALDTESEELVQEALNNLMRGRTTITIAHRLSTIKNSDVIYVLGNGSIQEKGTHNELLFMSGLYRQLYEAQLTG